MTGRSRFLLGLAALAVAAVVLTLRSLREDLRRTDGQAAEHESAHAGRIEFP